MIIRSGLQFSIKHQESRFQEEWIIICKLMMNELYKAGA